MPLERPLGVGSSASASAVATFRRVFILAADPAVNTPGLLVYGLPALTFYIQQTVGALGATVIPQFAVRSLTGALVPDPEWLPLAAPFIINPGITIPTLVQYTMPARRIRLVVQRSPGVATTLTVVMAGSI